MKNSKRKIYPTNRKKFVLCIQKAFDAISKSDDYVGVGGVQRHYASLFNRSDDTVKKWGSESSEQTPTEDELFILAQDGVKIGQLGEPWLRDLLKYAGIDKITSEELVSELFPKPESNSLLKKTTIRFLNMAVPPSNFVIRPRVVKEVLDVLLSNEVTNRDAKFANNRTIALYGFGGFGKTTLAKYICHLPEISAAFPDGILWVKLGEDIKEGTIYGGLCMLYAAITGERPNIYSIEDAEKLLSEALEGRQCLVVIDDVWNKAHLRRYQHCKVGPTWLITTRNLNSLPEGAIKLDVDVMEPEEAMQLLAFGLDKEGQEGKLQELTDRLGKWPTLLNLVNAQLRKRCDSQPLNQALKYVEDALDEHGLFAFDVRDAQERDQAVAMTVSVSLAILEKSEAERYLELPIFLENIDIPLVAIERLWGYTGRLSKYETESLCEQLFDLSLLLNFDPVKRFIRLHDVLRHFLLDVQECNMPELHQQLLAAYLVDLPIESSSRSTPWEKGPDDGYYFQNLPRHLLGAGETSQLLALLCHYPWLEAKLKATDINVLIYDYDLLGEQFRSYMLIQGALCLSTHVLFTDKTQLPSQLLGRLSRLEKDPPDGILSTLLASIYVIDRPWLCPLTASLAEPGGTLLRTLSGHKRMVSSICVTNDGKYAITGSHDGFIKVWNVTSWEPVCTIDVQEKVYTIAVTPDGRYIVSGSDEGIVMIWKLVSGEKVRPKEEITHSLETVSRDEDNWAKLVDWFEREKIRGSVVELRSNKYEDQEQDNKVYPEKNESKRINSIAIMPDGQYIVTGSADKSLKVWSFESEKEVFTLGKHTEKVWAVVGAPDSRTVISGSADNTLKVWSFNNDKVITLTGHKDWVTSVTLTQNGRYVISGSCDKTLNVYDLENGEEKWSLTGHTSSVTAVASTPDGKYIVSGSADCSIKVWSLEKGKEVFTLGKHNGGVSAIAITPNGRFVISGSNDGILKVWELLIRQDAFTPPSDCESIESIALTLDGSKAVSGSWGNNLYLWDVNHRYLKCIIKGHFTKMKAIAITPDGQYVISGSGSGILIKREIESGKIVKTHKGHDGLINDIAITPDGRYLISAAWDQTIKVWRLDNWEEVRRFSINNGVNMAITVTPDGGYLVLGVLGNIKVWELESRDEIHTIDNYRASMAIGDIAVTPDRRYAIRGSLSSIIVWDLMRETEMYTIRVHSNYVKTIAITHGGRYIISGSRDNSIKLIELTTGNVLAAFTDDGSINALAISPDGKTIVAGGDTGRMHFLSIEGV